METFAEVSTSSNLPPVDIENVSQHTDSVVRSYINFRLSHDHLQHFDFDEDIDDIGSMSDRHTGQRLATVAEEFDRVNGSDLERLVQQVASLTGPNATEDDWFMAFRLVADSVAVGEFSWTKLVMIFCFGYRLLQKAWSNGWRQALAVVSGAIIRYLLQEHVLKWIARHGGWLAANCLRVTQTMDMTTSVAVAVGTGIAAALVSFSVIFLVKRRALGGS